MKRVAEVIGQLTTGGAELQLAELVSHIDRDRFEPIVYDLSGRAGRVASRLEARGVTVRAVGASGPARVVRLARALRRDRIDLVHSWLYLANTYAWAADRIGGRLPLITSARNCKSQGRLHHAANMAAFRASARIIVNSEEVLEYVATNYRADRRRIAVVHNGVDTGRFRPGPPSDGPPVIVTVGRLVAQKNPLLFLEAARRVKDVVPEVRFRILGDGPLRSAVLDGIRTAGLEGEVEMLGEREDVEVQLGRSSLFWLTSSWEGLPNVVLEAMACGLPVVVTDVGGARELLTNGREGFLVRPGAAEEFVEPSLALLRDPGFRARSAAAARERALAFSLERMADATERTYLAALGC